MTSKPHEPYPSDGLQAAVNRIYQQVERGTGNGFSDSADTPGTPQRGNREGLEDVIQEPWDVLDALGQAVLVHDSRGRLLRYNARATGLLGISPAHLHTPTSLCPDWVVVRENGCPFPPDAFPTVVTLETGQTQANVIVGVQRSDGNRAWLSVSTRPLLRSGETRPYAVVSSFSDITIQRVAEEALRASEERFRCAFEDSAIGMALAATDGRLIRVNHALCKITGYSQAELLGRPFQSITHADDLEENLALLQRTLVGELAAFQLEKRYIHKAGHIVWVLVSVSLLREPGGQPLMFVSQVKDITARRQTEEALRESEARFRLVAHATSDVIFDWDLVLGQMSYLHLRFAEGERSLFGYAGEEVGSTTKWWVDRLHDDDRQRILAELDEAVSGKADQSILDYRFRRIDGTYAYVNQRASILRGGDGRATRMIGAMTDVTHRMEAGQRLQASEAALSAAQELARLGSWEWEWSSDTLRWSDQHFRIFGREPSSEPLTFQHFIGQVHADDRGAVEKAVDIALRDRVPFDLEYRIVRLDGEIRTVHSRGHVILDRDGGRSRMIGTVQDISERARALERLAASHAELRHLAQSLQSVKEAEQKRISREIHDELGQTLTALRLDITWLARRLRRTDPITGRRAELALQLIDTATDAVQRIATDLRPPVLDELGLRAAIQWETEEFQRRSGVRCEVQLPPGQLELSGEQTTTVFRVLQEALTNVARHAEADTVGVRLEVVDGRVLLVVHDNGRGIPSECSSNSQSLGLVGMRERALALDGSVLIAGAPGEGTTLTLDLPLAPAPPSS